MIRKLNLVCLFAFALCAASCRQKVNYACQCYQEGVPSNTYEMGKIDGKIAASRCHAMQQQNHEDTCQAATALK